METYNAYRERILRLLSDKVREEYGYPIDAGYWRGEKRERFHILPLSGKKNNRQARIDAISKYLGVIIDERFLPAKNGDSKESLHPYAHHLNSSQLLCYMAFGELIAKDYKPEESLVNLLASLGINISSEATCTFEYHDDMRWENEPEGTSFDFHISDKDKEYFFEIKFTEDGFGKAKNDDRHKQKITEVYRTQIENLIGIKPENEQILRYYQLFRNILRANSDSKTVVFITDANNPKTERDLKEFQAKFQSSSLLNVKHLTWQQICDKWQVTGIAKPFQFSCFENTSSL